MITAPASPSVHPAAPPTEKLPSRRDWLGTWFGPALLSGVFLVVLGVLLFLIHADSQRRQEVELAESMASLAANIQRQVDGTRDYLVLLATERARGTLTPEEFQWRVSRYVADHPELINITWVDSGFVIRHVAPLAGNQQIIGLALSLPEPARASSLARSLQQPVYTRPFEAIQGKPSFEVWVPVFHENDFLGLFAGVYSCPRLLELTVPVQITRRHVSQLLDERGGLLAEIRPTATLPAEVALDLPLSPPGNGLVLRLYFDEVFGWDWKMLLVVAFCMALALGMVFGLWALKRDAIALRGSKERLRNALRDAQQGEEHYRGLFENNHAVMLLIHPEEQCVLDANPAAAAYYGWSREELCGKHVCEINALPQAEVLAQLAQARQASGYFSAVHRLADGTVREVEVLRGPITLGGRSLIHSIVHDITERKKMQTAWRMAQFCIDHAAIAIFRIDETGAIREANYKASASLGYTPEELCSLSIFDIDATFSKERWHEHRKNIRLQGAGTIETLHRRRDGSVFPVEVNVSYLEYEGQTLSYSFAQDITERKRAEELLRHQATHDELTGLANRALLHDRLRQSIHYANRSRRSVAVLLLDLDRFKIINDSLGHSVGDELLISAAHRIEETVREADTVSRSGGDEFVIVLAEVAEEGDVGLVARKILDNLSRPYQLQGREITVAASLGISIYPRDGADGETLLRNADIAMYRAKEEGDTFRLYAPEMNIRVHEMLELEADLRHALARGELCVHYQPKVDIASGQIIGAEALVRWRHPQRGMISPGMFIPLAEETGLILPIGEWVLATVCAQVKEWQKQGLPAVPVAVNLSARQFRKPGLADLVHRTLQESGIDPGLLELELTESMIMHDPHSAADMMRQLKTTGVSLALDDFGTGYSSLNYLRRFPVDHLKIDRSFISEAVGDPSAAAVAATVVAIAHSLGLTAIAEGVETREQLELLASWGCNAFQGYLFSPALPADDFAELVRGRQRMVTVERQRQQVLGLPSARVAAKG